jgi:hypothetical protein
MKLAGQDLVIGDAPGKTDGQQILRVSDGKQLGALPKHNLGRGAVMSVCGDVLTWTSASDVGGGPSCSYRLRLAGPDTVTAEKLFVLGEEEKKERIFYNQHNFPTLLGTAWLYADKWFDVVTGKRRHAKPNGNIAMFRLVDGPWYDGVIHETVAAWEERRHYSHGTTRGNVTRSRIADYGHAPEIRAKLGKDLRNILLLERAHAMDPSNPVPLTYLALEYATKDAAKANDVCERAWAFVGHPKLIGAQFLRLVVARCWCALRRKDAQRAWETLNEWDAREGVEHPDVLTLRGMVAEALGMREHAIAMYRAAVAPTDTVWTVRYIASDTARESLRGLGAA